MTTVGTITGDLKIDIGDATLEFEENTRYRGAALIEVTL